MRTYIASGNVICYTPFDEDVIKRRLAPWLQAHVGKPVEVVVRTAEALTGVLARCPFSGAPGSRVTIIFMDEPVTPTMLDGVTGIRAYEAVGLGKREIYVRYGPDMARSKLQIPAAAALGTARNMKTVTALARIASD